MTVSGWSGAGWFQVDSGVPEPSTLSLVGLAGFAVLAWRRKC
ncbi:MAG: PEP-CTERM sorting domain-containing protein [Acidobacteriales bacterium]|nr:PEP-CTERM sorting domain-containing protein [Terriglobales bacterium]